MDEVVLYWPSAIVQTKSEKKPFLWYTSEAEMSLARAKEVIKFMKEAYDYEILSAWVEAQNTDGMKSTVFHECFVDTFGFIQC